MTITLIGVGLMGGSMVLSLKEREFAHKIIGVDKSEANLERALQLGIIDEKAELTPAIKKADLIIAAIPVNSIETLLPQILDQINDQQIVIDLGSTKSAALKSIKDHPRRGRFVATHPMTGTEFSGPNAAFEGLYDDKCTVLCDSEHSDKDAVDTVKQLYKTLNMRILEMNAEEHDMHTAYVSHISHISSFALALTVLEKEKEEKHIFDLASGGFRSTVRLAKSSSAMWVPIFMQNRHNVLDVLYELIFQLKKMKQLLIDKDAEGFDRLIKEANQIKRII